MQVARGKEAVEREIADPGFVEWVARSVRADGGVARNVRKLEVQRAGRYRGVDAATRSARDHTHQDPVLRHGGVGCPCFLPAVECFD